MKLFNKFTFWLTRKHHWVLIPWCWLCYKLDRCDWCFAKIEHNKEDHDWMWCSSCTWGPEYPSRWEA